LNLKFFRELSKESRAKQEKFVDLPRSEYLEAILENLSPDDVRFLIRLEDELAQASHFMKIFPTPVIFDQLKSRILAFMLKFRF
jgi:hypothetical protein